jgi:hypothetical protein
MRCVLGVFVVAVLLVGSAGSGLCSDGYESKSLKKALVFSLLLPGAGQHYLGNHTRARMMYVAEAGVWTAFAGFRIQGGMREDRYKEMARLFAGVECEMDDDYALALAHYGSSEEYNIDVMREARYLYPDDRERQLAYFDMHGYFGRCAWEWESPEKRKEFENTRTWSRESYRRAVLTTGFAVLNRVVSMVDIYLSFKLASPDGRTSLPSLRVDRRPEDGYRFYLSKSF